MGIKGYNVREKSELLQSAFPLVEAYLDVNPVNWEESNNINNFVKVGELEIHKIYPQALTVKGYISAVKEISRTLLDNEKMLTPLLSIIYGASGGYDEQKTMCVYLHGCDHQPTVNIRGNGEVDY